MEGNVGPLSQLPAVSNSDSLLLEPSSENAPPCDTSATVLSLEAPTGTLDGPCSAISTCDVDPLPASCVVEDDSLLPGYRRHHYPHYRRHRGSTGRRHHHRHRCCRVKWKEVNFVAAMLNIVAAVLVCTSLAEPRWWYLGGSTCMNYDRPATHLGIKQFFYKGFFVDRSSYGSEQMSKYYYGTMKTEVLVNCVTPQTVCVVKAIIALCFVVIGLCLAAVLFDVVVFTNRCMKAVRHHAILSILAVCICVTINGLSYLVTRQLAKFYETQPSVDLTKLDVEFSFCFYIIMSAGILCVFSVAFSLLCRRSCHAARGWCPEATMEQAGGRRRRDERLIDADICGSAGTAAPVSALPPPYTP